MSHHPLIWGGGCSIKSLTQYIFKKYISDSDLNGTVTKASKSVWNGEGYTENIYCTAYGGVYTSGAGTQYCAYFLPEIVQDCTNDTNRTSLKLNSTFPDNIFHLICPDGNHSYLDNFSTQWYDNALPIYYVKSGHGNTDTNHYYAAKYAAYHGHSDYARDDTTWVTINIYSVLVNAQLSFRPCIDI